MLVTTALCFVLRFFDEVLAACVIDEIILETVPIGLRIIINLFVVYGFHILLDCVVRPNVTLFCK